MSQSESTQHLPVYVYLTNRHVDSPPTEERYHVYFGRLDAKPCRKNRQYWEAAEYPELRPRRLSCNSWAKLFLFHTWQVSLRNTSGAARNELEHTMPAF